MPLRIKNGRPAIVAYDSYEEAADLKRALLGASALAVLGSVLIGPLPKTTIGGGVLAALSFLTQVEDGAETIEATETGERLAAESTEATEATEE
jgi:hypothetical protein